MIGLQCHQKVLSVAQSSLGDQQRESVNVSGSAKFTLKMRINELLTDKQISNITISLVFSKEKSYCI